MAMRILLLEPYHGGSHKLFLDHLERFLAHRFDRLTLPPRAWKWRMRLAAPHFAAELERRKRQGMLPAYDLVLSSDYLDVAAFKGLVSASLREVPLFVYFHENQFAYPVRRHDPRDLHFGLTNLTTVLAAEGIGFNSRYNLMTLLQSFDEILAHAPDSPLLAVREAVERKGRILPVGIDGQGIDAAAKGVNRHSVDPVILWNHRWEHDKGPELFLRVLVRLKKRGRRFKVMILGRGFREIPEAFEKAVHLLGDRLLAMGWVEERSRYYAALHQADVVVSTAGHEFYGIAVLEAVRAGCRPLLPARLAYPEHFPGEYLYTDEEELVEKLERALAQGRLHHHQALDLTRGHTWPELASTYESWFASAGDRREIQEKNHGAAAGNRL